MAVFGGAQSEDFSVNLSVFSFEFKPFADSGKI